MILIKVQLDIMKIINNQQIQLIFQEIKIMSVRKKNKIIFQINHLCNHIEEHLSTVSRIKKIKMKIFLSPNYNKLMKINLKLIKSDVKLGNLLYNKNKLIKEIKN